MRHVPKSALRIRACTPFTTSTTCEMSKSVAAREVGVGELRVHAVAGLEQRDRGAHAVLHRDVEVLVHAGRDQVLGGLGERPGELAEAAYGVLARHHVEPDGGPQRRLHRGQRHLAVALGEVRVADVGQRARRPAPAGRAWRPTVSRLMSMLPPCGPGGTECGRASPATATPMIPRNGASGNSTAGSPPGRQRQQPVGAVVVDGREDAEDVALARVLARAARPCRAGWRSRRTAPAGSVSTTVIASRSPGRAPSTRTGRLTTCGPSTPNVRGSSLAAISIASSSTSADAVLPEERLGVPALVLEDALVADGVEGDLGARARPSAPASSAAQGSRPHSTWSGVDGRYAAPRIGPDPGLQHLDAVMRARR